MTTISPFLWYDYSSKSVVPPPQHTHTMGNLFCNRGKLRNSHHGELFISKRLPFPYGQSYNVSYFKMYVFPFLWEIYLAIVANNENSHLPMVIRISKRVPLSHGKLFCHAANDDNFYLLYGRLFLSNFLAMLQFFFFREPL